MLTLLLSWVFIGWLSLVFGLMSWHGIFRLLSREQNEPVGDTPVDYTLLLGFVAITTLSSIISIFFPLNLLTVSLFVLAGVAGTVRFYPEIILAKQVLQTTWKSVAMPLKAAILALMAISCFAAFMDIGESDTWFYHSQAILWIKKYAAVPGLGNIHGRFAFNSHFFISSAFFSFFLAEDRVIFPLLSFFYLVFNIRLLVNIYSSIKSQNGFSFVLNTFLFLFFAHQVFGEINGTDTDSITTILLLYALLLFLTPNLKNTKLHWGFLLWVLVLTAATFKLSACLAGLLVLVLFPQLFHRRNLAVFGAAAAVIILPFIVRNILLSGYLLYPFPGIDIVDVDWKIPLHEVVYEKELVEGWAKLPDGMIDGVTFEDVPKVLQLPFGEWFSSWWPHQSLRWRGFMLINLFSVVLFLVALFKKNYRMVLLSGAILVNLLFWFFEAPEPRFGAAFLFFGAALIFALVLKPVFKIYKPSVRLFWLFALFLLALPPLKHVVYTPWQPNLLFYPVYEAKVKTEPFQAGNFTMRIPSKEPPAKGYWCYCAPLPCTPFPKKNVVMRGKSYQDGFRCEAEKKLQPRSQK